MTEKLRYRADFVFNPRNSALRENSPRGMSLPVDEDNAPAVGPCGSDCIGQSESC